jgi:hypothetical protein
MTKYRTKKQVLKNAFKLDVLEVKEAQQVLAINMATII